MPSSPAKLIPYSSTWIGLLKTVFPDIATHIKEAQGIGVLSPTGWVAPPRYSLNTRPLPTWCPHLYRAPLLHWRNYRVSSIPRCLPGILWPNQEDPPCCPSTVPPVPTLTLSGRRNPLVDRRPHYCKPLDYRSGNPGGPPRCRCRHNSGSFRSWRYNIRSGHCTRRWHPPSDHGYRALIGVGLCAVATFRPAFWK